VQRIVVGIDGSDASRKALRWAIDNAGDAEVVALHAYDVLVSAQDATPTEPSDLVGLAVELHEGAIRLATAIVDEVAGEDSTVTVTVKAVEGPPVEVLLEAAGDADLLAVGSHGAGLAEVLLGSVSLECVQRSPCPVLVHRS
jgi:nucleotide-binding universal stress UspA family protein